MCGCLHFSQLPGLNPNSVLIPLENADPFSFLLSNTRNQITLASLKPVTVIDGLVLDQNGPGGWDISRADEYDVAISFGRSPLIFGQVANAAPCSNTVDFGQIIQGNDAAGVLSDVITVLSTWRLSVEGFSISGTGAAAFDIPDFHQVTLGPNESATFDVLLDVKLSPGLYEAVVEFSAEYSIGVIIPLFPGGASEAIVVSDNFPLFEFRAEILNHPADCNDDGRVDGADLACVADIEQRDMVLEELSTLPGDLDGNGDVSFTDFLVLSANFGQDLPNYTDGNIDLKNEIDFADFLELSNNFGKTPSDVAPVPEPNGLAMIWLGLLGGAAFRRHRGR